jgi:hypothetical protein
MKQLLYILVIIAFFQFRTVNGQESPIKSKRAYYGGIHFAGNMGLLSANFGKKFFNEKLVLGAGYGYLPQSVNGVEVHSIILKTSFNFSKGLLFKDARWYGGFSTIYGITNNTYVKYPSHYPADYYATNAIHFSPYIGLRMPFFIYKPSWATKMFIHTELGILDSYLWYSMINKQVKLWDICNLSVGIYYDL